MTLSFAAFCLRQRRFRRLTDFIGASLDEDELRLHDLADIACLSPAQLMRLYRSRTGEGPMQTVRRLRLQRARSQLLLDPAISVTEVAFAAGYDSNAAFTHAFRRHFGAAPSQLRLLSPQSDTSPPLRLVRFPERKVWQFRYTGTYADNGHYKARLAWLYLTAGNRGWRGWRLNDRDHPFTEDDSQHVALSHFVPLLQQSQRLPEADRVTLPGGLCVVTEINPADRERCMAELAGRVRAELHCVLTEQASMEQDLHVRDFHPPQDRRIALYVPVRPIGRLRG